MKQLYEGISLELIALDTKDVITISGDNEVDAGGSW